MAVTWSLSASAGELTAGGCVLLRPGKPEQGEGGPIQLRRSNTFHLLSRKGEPARATVVGVFREARYRLRASDGRVLLSGAVTQGERRPLELPVGEGGVLRLETLAGGGAAAVDTGLPMTVRMSGLHIFRGRVRRLHFWVPPGAKSFRVHVRGGGMDETARVRVFAPDGGLAGEKATTTKSQKRFTCTVAPEQAGRIWSMTVSKGDYGIFEDCTLWLSGDVIPYVAESPQQLFVPYACVRPGSREATVSFPVRELVPQVQGAAVHVRDVEDDRVLVSRACLPVPEKLSFPMTHASPRLYRWRVELTDRDGQNLGVVESRRWMAKGYFWVPEDKVDEGPPPELTQVERDRGWATFWRAEPGDMRRHCAPRRDEIVSRVSAQAARGEHEPLYFGLYPSRKITWDKLEVTPFRRESGEELPRSAVDLRAATYWPQRTSAKSRTFRVIPEMLEHVQSLRLQPGRVEQIWVTVRVPAGAAPGMYRSAVQAGVDGRTVRVVAMELEVLPFELDAVDDRTWGLWSDCRRWVDYSGDELRRELRDMRDHGITSLLISPFRLTELRLRDGHLEPSNGTLSRLLRAMASEGLNRHNVLSVSGIESLSAELAGAEPFSEDALKMWGRTLQQLTHDAEQAGWDAILFRTHDEPNSPRKLSALLKSSQVMKRFGAKVFTTCRAEIARTAGPLLDAPCYSSGELRVGKENVERIQKECRESGDLFFWYGFGSYGGQDGNLQANRLRTGFYFYKTGADGAWGWTFQRCRGNPYSDFDGSSGDYCVTYPQRHGHGSLPTIQWEAVREGVDDYRYVRTLRVRIQRARQSKLPRLRGLATQSDKRLQALVEQIPLSEPETYTNAQMRALRSEITRMVLALDLVK